MAFEGKNLVGVDIGTSAVKVVQVRESRRGVHLMKYGVEPLPPQSIVDGHVMNGDAVQDKETIWHLVHFVEAASKGRKIKKPAESIASAGEPKLDL